MSREFDPYCGSAPLMHELLGRWNLDPVLLAAIIMYGAFCHMRFDAGPARRLGLASTLLLLVAFVSPLCALTSALFSARAFHHLLVTSIIAPCIVLAFRDRFGKSLSRLSPIWSGTAFLAVLWAWHLPQVYAFALTGSWQYWTLQLALLATSLWLWNDLLSPLRSAGTTIATAMATAVQMGMLGALLTFAARPMFAAHFLTTEPYGLSALGDQQLAGLIMWVPSALPFILVALKKLEELLSRTAAPTGAP